MKTACFFEFAGAGRVSIARYPPRGTPPGFRVYKPLAPGPWFNSVDRAMYEKLYFAQLAKLDASAAWNELHLLTDGVEPVLLCWEKHHDTVSGRTFCHRHMVARWFKTTLGHEVRELGFP